MDIFAPYLNTTIICSIGDRTCWPKDIHYLSGVQFTFASSEDNAVQAVLTDSAMISFYVRSPDCKDSNGNSRELSSVCGVFDIDINGKAKANQIGKDIFSFYITKYNILPLGTDGDMDSFQSNCNKSTNGWGCAAWVIINENMDYLHCNYLNWQTKIKCN